jgi:hypothetical protein
VACGSHLEERPVFQGEYQKHVANSEAEQQGVKANAESKNDYG